MTTNAADHTTRAHSRLGASAAHRWMACPGSVAACADMADETSVFAAEGTAAHELAEWCFKPDESVLRRQEILADPAQLADFVRLGCGRLAEEMIGRVIKVGKHEFIVDEEMATSVQLYVDTVREILQPGDLLLIEQRFHLHQIDEQFFGTSDACIYRPLTKWLFVFDLKYGRGHAVEVERNPQFLYYGLGAALAEPGRGVGDVELVVVQPRCPHPDGPVRRWRTTAVEMIEFSHMLVEAAAETRQANAPRIPGEHCKFCAAAAVCKELRAHVQRVAAADFEAPFEQRLLPTEPVMLTADELAAILDERETIKAWLKAVEQYAHNEANAGRPPTGYKLVATKEGNRTWRDEKSAQAVLELMYGLDEASIFKPKLLESPAKIEKLLGKAKKDPEFVELYYRPPPSGSVLVSVDDPREPIKRSAVADFAGA